MVWPAADIPTYGRGVWLKCNGQSFSTTQFPQLYRTLGTNRVPDYQGMFLRGYGNQSYSQDNGEFTSSITNYSSGNIGQIQGDSFRHIIGGINDELFFGSSDKISQYRFTPLSEMVRNKNAPNYFHYKGSPFAVNGLEDNTDSDYGRLVDRKPMYVPMHPQHYKYTISCSGGGEDDNEGGGISCELNEERVDWEETHLSDIKEGVSFWNQSYRASMGIDTSMVVPTSNEIRPVNVAVKFMIKAK